MNERIKELMNLAGAKYDSKGNMMYPVNFHEVFAELIVQECAEVCRQQSDDYCSEDWNRCANDCAVIVLEHFGVE